MWVQLSRELQDIMKEQDPGLGADAVGDDVYLWDVWLSGFDPSSDLAEVRPVVLPADALRPPHPPPMYSGCSSAA